MKTAAAVGVGGLGITGATRPALACATYNGCSRISSNTTYDAYFGGHTAHLGSALERTTVASFSDYWTHTFKMAGDGVAIEDGQEIGEIASQNMIIKNKDTSQLSVFTSRNEKETGMMPESEGGSGSAVVDVATGVVSAAATAVKSTAGSLALAATTIAEGLINLFADYSSTSEERYSFTGTYNAPDKGGHHLRFKVDEYEDNDPYATYDIDVRSEFGLAINGWTVSFGDRGVVLSENVDTTSVGASATSVQQDPDVKWEHPREMSRKAARAFGVKKVKASSVPEYARNAVDSSKDYLYVAENAPVSTQELTPAEKREIRNS